MRPGLRHFGAQQLLHAAPFVRDHGFSRQISLVLALPSCEEVDGGRLDSVDLRQLPTAWLDCWSWTEDNIPRLVELESSHILDRIVRQTWNS